MQLRSTNRIPLIARGTTALLNSDQSGNIYTTNISRGGLCFFSITSLPVHSELLLQIDLNGPTEHVHGRLLWKKELGEMTAHGVQLLTELTPDKTPRLLQHASTLKFLRPSPPSARKFPGKTKEVLTGREREIARLIAMGYSNREMGQRLSITTKTIETHRSNIYSKLEVHNAVQLLRALEKSGKWVFNQDQKDFL